MKTGMIALIGILILAFIGLGIYTVSGRNIRATELEAALNSAIEQTMETAYIKETYPIQTEEQMIADMTAHLMTQISSNSAVEIRVYNIDVVEGLLDVEAIETFKHFLGNTGTISVRKTVILETVNTGNGA